MSRLKPKVRMTADGRFRPLLSYSDGPKQWGPRLTFKEALKRAQKACNAAWRVRVMQRGIQAETDDRIAEYERNRPMRVTFGEFPNHASRTLRLHRSFPSRQTDLPPNPLTNPYFRF